MRERHGQRWELHKTIYERWDEGISRYGSHVKKKTLEYSSLSSVNPPCWPEIVGVLSDWATRPWPVVAASALPSPQRSRSCRPASRTLWPRRSFHTRRTNGEHRMGRLKAFALSWWAWRGRRGCSPGCRRSMTRFDRTSHVPSSSRPRDTPCLVRLLSTLRHRMKVRRWPLSRTRRGAHDARVPTAAPSLLHHLREYAYARPHRERGAAAPVPRADAGGWVSEAGGPWPGSGVR